MFDDCLIMAGGSGTRLWPASNSRLPKQFLPADEKMSFFSLSLERAFAVTGKDGRVIVITAEAYIPLVTEEAAKLDAEKKKRLIVIGEPFAKNTAPAAACAVVFSLFGGANRKILVLTCDHIIEPLKVFKADAALAAACAGEGKLAVFGIPPSRPETGYGYIEIDRLVSGLNNVYSAAAFHEKPDEETAKKYAASGHFFWNSGMFAFSSGFMAEQFRLLAPEVFKPFEKLKKPLSKDFAGNKGVKILKSWKGLKSAYQKAESISFDYAIAEKCQKTVMIRINFNWLDIGNWEEYAKIHKNSHSDVYNAESSNCYVDSDIPVALAGVDDLIVVIRSGKNTKNPAVLITKKGQTQKVKEIVAQIKASGKPGLL